MIIKLIHTKCIMNKELYKGQLQLNDFCFFKSSTRDLHTKNGPPLHGHNSIFIVNRKQENLLLAEKYLVFRNPW